MRTPASTDARRLEVAANAALVPGGTYRLWIAFDKPMRFRDSSGAVVAYPGQTTDADTGSATLEIRDAGETDIDVPVGNADAWLDTAGGAPDGYLRYADDALAVDFTIPDGLAVTSPVPAVLAIDNQGISGLGLDADPSTPVDFASGVWTGYEDATGAPGDTGGIDCSGKPFVAMDPDAAPPAENTECSAATVMPPPPPPPPPPPSGSGGGAAGILMLLFCLGAVRRRISQAD